MLPKAYPTYRQSLGILAILFLCALLSVLMVMPFIPIESAIGLSLTYFLCFSMTVVVTLKIRGDYSFATNKFSPALIGIASITILCIHFALDPLTSLVPISKSLQKMFEDTLRHPFLLFALVAVAAPVLEELLFRGIILHGLLKNYKPIYAIVFSALLFALIHGNLAQGIGALFLGALIGWVYWKSQSVVACILIHFINNSIAFISILLTPKEDLFKSMQDQIGNTFYYWLLVIGSAAITGAGIWLLHAKYLQESDSPPVQELSDQATN